MKIPIVMGICLGNSPRMSIDEVDDSIAHLNSEFGVEGTVMNDGMGDSRLESMSPIGMSDIPRTSRSDTSLAPTRSPRRSRRGPYKTDH